MNEQNLYGIDSIKSVLKFFIKSAMSYQEANEDGKVTKMEWLMMAPGMVTNLISAIINVKDSITEWKDLIDAEREDLVVWMKNEYDVEDEKTERVVEKIFTAIMSIDSVIDEFVQNEPEAPTE